MRRPLREGSELCSVCRLVHDAPGLRRCSRLVARSAAMRGVLVRVAPIAASAAPVMILGESGS